MQPPECRYVSTLAYRRAIDEAWQAREGGGESGGGGEGGGGPPPAAATSVVRDEVARERRSTPPPLAADALRQVFARGQDEVDDGHTPGFFDGPRHQSYVRGLSPSHRGVWAATVVEPPSHNTVRVRLAAELSAGDGVAFGAATSGAGGTLWGVHRAGGAAGGAGGVGSDETVGSEVDLELEDGRRLAGVRVGDLVWRTQHAALQRQLKGALADTSAGRALVDVAVSGAIGEPLTLTVTDGRGRSASAQTGVPLQPASGAPLDEEALRRAVGQLGGTPLVVRGLDVSCVMGGAWLPVSQVKEARRAAVESLLELRAAQRVEPPPPRTAREEEAREGTGATCEGQGAARGGEAKGGEARRGEARGGEAHLSVLCRTREQVAAAAACEDVDEIVVDFLELDGIVDALAAARPKATVVAAPRIIKPAEEALWRVLLKLEGADAILVRSAGLLMRLSALADEEGATLPRIHADFSLNVANSAAARAFLDLNVRRLAPTFDLDARQLCDLAAALPAAHRARLEVIVHANVPIFHTEHCVFANTLSSGNSYKDCGHPCTRHSLHLADEHSHRHLVLADSGCRNTVFNSQPQSAAPYLGALLDAGVRNLRVELTDQPGAVVAPLLQRYAALVRTVTDGEAGAGDEAASELLEWLQGNLVDSTGHRPGVTTGSFRPAAERTWASLRPTAAEARAKQAVRGRR